MKSLRRLIRTTLVGGVLFLIPLVFVVVVVGKAFQIMKVVGTPLAKLIPVESFAGYAVVELLTAIIMILFCLLAGTLARSPWGRKIHEKLDAVLLQMIPGYAWVKGITGDIRDDDAEDLLKPVLVRFDDQAQLALEVDRAADGMVAVYVPGAPDPRSGALSYVTEDRIQPVNAGLRIGTTKRLFGFEPSTLRCQDPITMHYVDFNGTRRAFLVSSRVHSGAKVR